MVGPKSLWLSAALGVAVLLWLLLAGSGLFGAKRLEDADARSSEDRASFEAALFTEMEREPGLRGLPGMDHRPTGEGVLRGTILVHVPDREPQPLPGVMVRVLGRSREARHHLPAEESGPDGTFTFPDVPAGSGYVLFVDHAPYRRVVLRDLGVGIGRTTDVGEIVLGAPTSLGGEVVDARGRPIRGARVQVLRDTGRESSFDLRRAIFELQAATAALADVEVGPDGRFLVKDLSPGRFVLRVTAPGHATTFKSDVLVTLDEHSSDVRVVLDRGAGFTGRVMDETGRGLGDARVIAVALPGRSLERLDRVETTTDPDGTYRLDTLIPGMTYGLEAWAEGFAPTGTYVREVAGITKRDWRLQPAGRIEGRVVDAETGAGIGACEVTVLAGVLSGVSPVSTTTDDDGAFVLPHVNPGPILLFGARAAGYQADTRLDFGAVQGRKVVAGETTWIEWPLRAGALVTGRITSDGGGPVAYAEVALVDRHRGRRGLHGEITAVSSADGAFELVGVRPGRYDLRVSAPGHAPPTDEEATFVHVTAELGEIRKDVVLMRGATLEGTVVSPEGEGVRGARVWLQTAGGGPDPAVVRDLAAVSAGSGRFRIAGVPPAADLRVRAEHDAWVESEAVRVRLTPGATREVVVSLRAGVKLPGRVTDTHGTPVPGARVRWGNVDSVRERDLRNSFDADEHLGPRVVRTDADGVFGLQGLAPGRLLLKVEAEGHAAWYRRDLMIGAESLQPVLTVELEPTLQVSGRVASAATGRGLAGAFVYARERGPAAGEDADPGRVQAVVSAEADAGGRYVLDRVPPGTHEIVVWFADGHIAAAQDWRHPKVRRKGVAAGSRGVDFTLDPLRPPDEPR